MPLIDSINTFVFISLILFMLSLFNEAKWVLFICGVFSLILFLAVIGNLFSKEHVEDENLDNLEPKDLSLKLISKLTHNRNVDVEFKNKLKSIRSLIAEIENKNGEVKTFIFTELNNKLILYLDLMDDSVKTEQTKAVLEEIQNDGIVIIETYLRDAHAKIIDNLKNEEELKTEALKMKQKMDGVK